MSTKPKPELIEQLKALGISERTAYFALSKTKNDVAKAADYALSGAAGKDEVSDKPKQFQSPKESSPSSQRPSLAPLRRLSSNASETPSLESNVSKLPPSKRSSPLLGSLTLWGGRRKKINSAMVEEDQGLALKGMGTNEDEKERGRRRKRSSSKCIIMTENENELTQTVPPPLPSNSYPPSKSTPPMAMLSLDDQVSNLILGAIDRGRPSSSPNMDSSEMKKTPSALAALGLRAAAIGSSSSVTPVPPKSPEKIVEPSPKEATEMKASFLQPSMPVGGASKGPTKDRAPSPFFRARRARDQARARDTSPEVEALKKDKDNGESDGESVGGAKKFRPQALAYEDESASEVETEEEGSGVDLDDEDILDEDGEVIFDEETEKNTEANAVFFEGDAAGLGGRAPTDDLDAARDDPDNRSQLDFYGEEVEQDVLGEGPNVVIPPASVFAVPSQTRGKKNKNVRRGLQLDTSRPSFARDRCTITLTQGDPDGALEESGKRMRRDGDEIFLISVKEDESKIDPKSWSESDKAQKLRIQKERQTTTLLLVKQVTGLLSRTRLQITVTCQFLHAKNARHMLIDLIDFLEPTMVIVGSRGLGKLQGILLGSTSHYLVQKSSVPVMVARRRLLRPLRRTNPANLRHSPRVSLASASIEKAASSKQEDDVVDVAQEEETANEAAIAAGQRSK
ncbi:hypothetical protein I312_106448 [Cryptococcus bacillisporus CA1280]|uniref:uncharacterized protein n=1 Tax=Cryptococcus bacillisporus CA1280 TaxID=1296109 RepID=UPI00336988CA